MTDTKPWWQSKTMWTTLVGALFAVLSLLKVLPADLDQTQVVAGVMAVVSVAAALFHAKSTKLVG